MEPRHLAELDRNVKTSEPLPRFPQYSFPQSFSLIQALLLPHVWLCTIKNANHTSHAELGVTPKLFQPSSAPQLVSEQGRLFP
jgi:hypothetical protein